MGRRSTAIRVAVTAALLLSPNWALADSLGQTFPDETSLDSAALTSAPAKTTVPQPPGSAPPPKALSAPVKNSVPPFPVAGPLSRAVQSVVGLNWLAGTIAGHVAKAKIQQKLGGKAQVNVKLYSFTDLLAGKIKSVKVKLTGCSINKLTLGELQVVASNPIWFDIGRRSHHSGLLAPVALKVTAQLTQKNITDALQSPKVTNSLRGLKLDLPGLGVQQLQVVRPKVELANDLIRIEALLITQGAPEETGVPVVITGRPVLQGSKIILDNMTVSSPEIIEPDKFAKFAQDLLNPIYDLGRMDRKDHAFRLATVDIKPDGLNGEGTLLLAPKQPVQLVRSVRLAQNAPKQK